MKQELEQAIGEAVAQLYNQAVDVELTRPDSQFGDFATNIALQLSKKLDKNPREIAAELAKEVQGSSSSVKNIDIAGPGFLNLTLTDTALLESLAVQPDKTRTDQIVLVEYSDPNPFKPLHAGHLYTTLVGDTIARLVERAGAQTIRLNFGGDVGLHVGKSMWAIIQRLGGEHPEKLAIIPEAERARWLGDRYVEGTTAYEENDTAKSQIIAANKQVYELHNTNDHESAFAQIYWTCRDWSYNYFKTLYQQLQVVPFARFIPESEVTPLGLTTVRDELAKGVFAESDGAIIYRGDEAKGLHTRVFINSEGIPTYEAKDVGLSLTKWRDYEFDQSIIITANEQSQYMQVVLAAISQFEPEAAARTTHITHGMVKLEGGAKMSSRKGNIISALDILESARNAARESQVNVTDENVLAAVKYAFAKARIGGDIVYNPNESIALEGNSGPYLQYAHARARSILGKAISMNQESSFAATALEDKRIKSHDLETGERLLVRKLAEYTEVVNRAAVELLPSSICTYLYELSQEFNRFYEKNRVIDNDREALRLHIVKTYADTLRDGLNLLGITAPNKM
jgi:arginyl-tRNA synthetase